MAIRTTRNVQIRPVQVVPSALGAGIHLIEKAPFDWLYTRTAQIPGTDASDANDASFGAFGGK